MEKAMPHNTNASESAPLRTLFVIQFNIAWGQQQSFRENHKVARLNNLFAGVLNAHKVFDHQRELMIRIGTNARLKKQHTLRRLK